MELIGILLIIVGFMLKLDTIIVVLISGLVTGLISGMSVIDVFNTIGTTFIEQRYIALFLILLPVIGVCERYGLKERAIYLIGNIKNLSTGKVISLYFFIRQITIAVGLRLGGHAEFVTPLVYPMAQGATINDYGKTNEKVEDMIKASSAAAENFGNFFAQNVFLANAGVLLIIGSLEDLGYEANPLDVSIACIPIAVITFILVVSQNYILDKKIKRELSKIGGEK